MAITPRSTMKTLSVAIETNSRLEKCWQTDISWELYPANIKKGCQQIGKAMSMPPSAILSGLITEVAFCMSHATVAVPGNDWVEPILLWIAIGMPTGSGKSPLYKYLLGLLRIARSEMGLSDRDPQWLLEEATFEKMGAMMAENHSKLLGLYDELSSFLTQINLYKARGLSDSHDLALFLQLYNGHPWSRKTVTGEANFTMDRTSLTIGGFTQPAVARSLIELPANIEKGLSPRFLWIFPEPCYAKFATLQPYDQQFTQFLVCLLKKMWSPTNSPTHQLTIPKPCETFSKKYDTIQDQLRAISGVDELLAGMLSKAKGLILRVAGVLHVLFRLDKPGDIPSEISEDALKAAEDYVDICCQHTAYLAGRGDIEDAVFKIQKAKKRGELQTTETASFILLLPGKLLDISALNTSHKFRNHGNKEGAVAAIKELEAAGLGVVKEEKATRGTSKLYKFEKKDVPKDLEEKTKLCSTLSTYHISLKQYEMQLKPIKKKRQAEDQLAPDVRRSPRFSGGASPTVTSPAVRTPVAATPVAVTPVGEAARRNLFQE